MNSETKDKDGFPESAHLLTLKATLDTENTHTHNIQYDTYTWGIPKENVEEMSCNKSGASPITPCPENDNGETVAEKESCGIVSKLKVLSSSVPRRKMLVLFLCTLGEVLSRSVYAVIAPFFPLVARDKGMDLKTIGLVFSLYQLGGVVVSPILGNFMNRIGIKFVYLSGIFVAGVSLICFGVLDKGPDGTLFTVMCILCRSFESLGASAASTSSIAIVSSEFPDHLGAALAFFTAGSSAGLIIGPVLGGALYSVGGFGLPFYVIGGLSLLDALLLYFCLPELQTVEHKRKKSVFSLLSNTIIFVPMTCEFVGVGGIGIFDATFATLVEPFKLSVLVVGVFYLVATGAFFTMSPVWGYLTDRTSHKELLIVFGLSVFGLGFLISGPSPLLPFVPFKLWSVGLGFTLLGFSLGSVTITSLACMTQGAYDLGYEKNIDTNAMISGLYVSCNSLGGFVGPLAGSMIVQNYGFPQGFTIFGLVVFTVMLFTLGHISIRCGGRCRKRIKANVSECKPKHDRTIE